MSIANLRVLVVKDAYECQGWTLVQLRCFRHRRCVSKSTPEKQSFINPNKWYKYTKKKSVLTRITIFTSFFFNTNMNLIFNPWVFSFGEKHLVKKNTISWASFCGLTGLTLLVTGFSDKLPVLLEAEKSGEGEMFSPLGFLQFYMSFFGSKVFIWKVSMMWKVVVQKKCVAGQKLNASWKFLMGMWSAGIGWLVPIACTSKKILRSILPNWWNTPVSKGLVID